MKKKQEFSKVLLNRITVITVVVTVFSAVMIWRTGDLSPLCYLIPAVFGEYAVGTAFYYRKAEQENKIKISRKLKSSGLEEIFREL